ncbi:MAG: hypothetical protein R3C97_02665 [Geminicoccaceae bacterium]
MSGFRAATGSRGNRTSSTAVQAVDRFLHESLEFQQLGLVELEPVTEIATGQGEGMREGESEFLLFRASSRRDDDQLLRGCSLDVAIRRNRPGLFCSEVIEQVSTAAASTLFLCSQMIGLPRRG